MAKKLISYDDQKPGLGLPEVVEQRLNAHIADNQPVPQTHFETTGVPAMVDEEVVWWESVAAKSDRVRVETVGTSVQGRPIQLVTIGYPAPPAAPETLDANSLLVVATQQGGEPAPREAVMQMGRDLAFTDNPEKLDYLRKHPVYLMPTVSPDGEAVSSYENANGVNINRDHLALEEPETRALHDVIRRVRPHLILDMHESGIADHEFRVVAGRYKMAHDAINQITSELYVHTTRAVAEATGSTVAEYGGSSQEPRALHISAQVSTCPVSVFESTSRGRPIGDRVADQKIGLAALMDYHHKNAGRVRAAVMALRTSLPTLLYFQHSNQSDPVPTGYRMTAAQWAQVQDAFAGHGLQVTQDGDDYLVTLDQLTGWIVPNLLDPTASWPIGTGERVHDPIPDYIIPEVRRAHAAQPRTYIKVFGEDELGTAPSGMTTQMGGDPLIVEEAGATNGRAAAFASGTPQAAAITAALNDPLAADSEILFRWRSSASPNGHGPSAFLRMTGAPPAHNGYRGGYRHITTPLPASGSAQLVSYVSGAATVLGFRTRTPLYEPSAWYLTRFRVEGELLALTIWKDGDPTPVLDQNVQLDTTHRGGWAGIGRDGASGFVVDWMIHTTGGGRTDSALAQAGSTVTPPPPEPEPDPGPGSTYTKIFAEDQIGDTPTGMTSLLPGTATIQEVEGATDGRALNLSFGDPVALAITDAMADPGLPSSEVLMRWRTGNSENHGPTVWHRLTAGESYNGYQLSYAHASTVGHARIATRTAGDYGALTNEQIPVLAVETWHLMRARVEGDQLMLKIWPESETEPAAWTATATSSDFTSGQTAIGQVGIGTNIWVDWMVHATGGDTAVAPA